MVMADPCRADMDNDGKVNGSDMRVMDSEMGRDNCYTSPCEADLNGDGRVDGEDKEILRSEFGRYNCLSTKEDIYQENIDLLQPEQAVQFDEGDGGAGDEAITSNRDEEKKRSKVKTTSQTSRFKDNEDGTVTDLETGLMWTKNADLYGDTLLFHQALAYLEEMNEGKYPKFWIH